MHLVSYFAVLDDTRGQLLLVAHRKAGLWLPAGGHVESGEDPWAAVVRECREELGIEAVASPVAGELPFFLTVTGTRGRARTPTSRCGTSSMPTPTPSPITTGASSAPSAG